MSDTHTEHINNIRKAKTQLREINNFMDFHTKEYRELLVLENLFRDAWTPILEQYFSPSEQSDFNKSLMILDNIREQQKELANATA